MSINITTYRLYVKLA